MDVIRAGYLALTLATFAVRAQEPAPPEPAPAEHQSKAAEAESLPITKDVAADLDEIEPAVPSAVLTADIGRKTTGNAVMDELDLRRTEITGNQELPKVLYIVPWQKSDPGELAGKPVNTLLDEILAPVDRTEFLRQVDYYGDLHGEREH